MQKVTIIVVTVVGVVILSGALFIVLNQQAETTTLNEDGYLDISSQELSNMMASKDFALINVHIPYNGEIDRTDSLLPFNDISGNLDMLPQDKSSKIVVYCRSGSMSATASKELVQMGYTNILNLSGGMNDWKESGFTIINR